ncbi:RHD3/Sey1, partial [Thamnocephalis sphaerospora]
NILVMDVEGVDGQERGEDKLVERRSALFSLAIAEVFVINVYEVVIGLHNGANIELLKTVFEANLRLSSKESKSCKTLIFFVIRDYSEQTPMDIHKQNMRATMETIWSAVPKPQGQEKSLFSDFFDCMFVGLPHKVFLPGQFDTAVDQLRLRFTEESNSDYVFKPCYHRKVPIDGLSHYSSTVWDAIVSDRHLDLPAQHKLLAQHRCGIIYSEADAKLKENLAETKEQLYSGQMVCDLRKEMKKAFDDAMALFDAGASGYQAEIYSETRSNLQSHFHKQMAPLFSVQLKALATQMADRFEEEMDKLHMEPTRYYYETADKICVSTLDEFEKQAEGRWHSIHYAHSDYGQMHNTYCLL